GGGGGRGRARRGPLPVPPPSPRAPRRPRSPPPRPPFRQRPPRDRYERTRWPDIRSLRGTRRPAHTDTAGRHNPEGHRTRTSRRQGCWWSRAYRWLAMDGDGRAAEDRAHLGNHPGPQILAVATIELDRHHASTEVPTVHMHRVARHRLTVRSDRDQVRIRRSHRQVEVAGDDPRSDRADGVLEVGLAVDRVKERWTARPRLAAAHRHLIEID